MEILVIMQLLALANLSCLHKPLNIYLRVLASGSKSCCLITESKEMAPFNNTCYNLNLLSLCSFIYLSNFFKGFDQGSIPAMMHASLLPS